LKVKEISRLYADVALLPRVLAYAAEFHTIQKETAVAILKKGLSGEPVRRLQAKLGVEADGSFGPGTEAALKDWQKNKGLAVDGVAGPDTFMTMGLYELVLLQEKLGVSADGQFGPGTEKAVRDYQQKNGLTVDGAAGPATLVHMQLYKEITADVVKASQVNASMLPDIGGAAKAAVSEAGAGMRSIWDTIKSAFK
jgi:peptidoglycan hydrolase-like protein with peptidoglycan-binding domain